MSSIRCFSSQTSTTTDYAGPYVFVTERWEASGYFPTLEQAVHGLTDLQLRDSKRPKAEVGGLGVSGAMTFL